MPTAQDVVNHIKKTYKPDEEIVAHIWCKEDVMAMGKVMEFDIDESTAQDILGHIAIEINSISGVNWQTIQDGIIDYDEYMSDNPYGMGEIIDDDDEFPFGEEPVCKVPFVTVEAA